MVLLSSEVRVLKRRQGFMNASKEKATKKVGTEFGGSAGNEQG